MLAAMVVGVIVTAAFGSDGPSPGDVVVEWITNPDDPTKVPTRGVTLEPGRPTTPPGIDPTPEPTGTVEAVVTGFTYPIGGACLPVSDNLMPGAPREYRQGIHEGIDLYGSDSCAFIGRETEVLAAKSGVVVRAGWAYEELDAGSLAALEATLASSGPSPEIEDTFRGRQVWIQHADGTVTRYAHLGGIAAGIDVGSGVAQGDLVAYVGESGTPESVTDPGSQVHLHFEIRVGESYLSAGLSSEDTRSLYLAAFAP